jgi:hypothetical protein
MRRTIMKKFSQIVKNNKQLEHFHCETNEENDFMYNVSLL